MDLRCAQNDITILHAKSENYLRDTLLVGVCGGADSRSGSAVAQIADHCFGLLLQARDDLGMLRGDVRLLGDIGIQIVETQFGRRRVGGEVLVTEVLDLWCKRQFPWARANGFEPVIIVEEIGFVRGGFGFTQQERREIASVDFGCGGDGGAGEREERGQEVDVARDGVAHGVGGDMSRPPGDCGDAHAAFPRGAFTWRDFEAQFTRQGEAYLKINDDPEDGPVKHTPRPGILILVKGCRDVLVSDIKLLNAPNWCLHVACCTDVLLTGLDIKSSLLMPNSGGLDVSLTSNVRISDCNIEAGDDAIAFSPCADGFGTGAAENIVVQNCVLLSRSAALRIGWGAHDFRNLLFNNIVIRDSNRGILINARYGETIENVVFSNIVIETRLYKGKWWGKGEPIHISAVAEFEDERRARAVRNVTFSNVTATGDHGVVIYGEGNSAIEDVTFDNCRLTLRPGALQESFGGNFDLRQFWDPARKVFAHDIPALFARGVKRLALRNVTVVREEGLPDFCRHALEIERFEDLVIGGFCARRAPVSAGEPEAEIMLRDGCEAVVRHAKFAPGGGKLLSAERVENLHDETSQSV